MIIRHSINFWACKNNNICAYHNKFPSVCVNITFIIYIAERDCEVRMPCLYSLNGFYV
jgi:hypothetical protein